jgi:hypothetical protein
MKPVGWIGVVCLVAGAIILALRGVSYTKDRQTVSVGPMSVSAEQKGFVPPYVGLVLLAVGGVLVFSGRGRKT